MIAGTDLSSGASYFEPGLLCVSAVALCASTPASESANTLTGPVKRPRLRSQSRAASGVAPTCAPM
jgi:hypothetical protein